MRPPGVTRPLILVSSAVLIADRVNPPFSIAALNAQSADRGVGVEVRHVRVRSSSAAAPPASARAPTRGSSSAGTPRRCRANELMIAPSTSPQVPWRKLRREVRPGQDELLRQLELLELLDDRRPCRRRGPEPERLRAGVLHLGQLGREVRRRRARRSSCPRSGARSLLASFATCAGPSRPKPPLSPISQTFLIPSLRRYAASL